MKPVMTRLEELMSDADYLDLVRRTPDEILAKIKQDLEYKVQQGYLLEEARLTYNGRSWWCRLSCRMTSSTLGDHIYEVPIFEN
jgi:hypothetical protein